MKSSGCIHLSARTIASWAIPRWEAKWGKSPTSLATPRMDHGLATGPRQGASTHHRFGPENAFSMSPHTGVTMQNGWDRTLSTSLTIAALGLAGLLIHREFRPSQPTRSTENTPRFVPDWEIVLPAGRTVGNLQAPVMVAVFSDLECAFCKRFHKSLQAVIAKYPEQVAYSFIHFPLLPNKHAVEAAQIAECASLSGRFSDALDFIFAHQDSLGARDWWWFADGIGIADSSAFNRCITDPAAGDMIQRGLAAGARMGVRGTPIIFLNGWRYPGAPSDEEFSRAVDDLVAGREPYKDFPAAAVNVQALRADQR